MNVKTVLAQLEPELGDPEANLARLGKAVREAKADLVLFPELYLTGYMIRDEVARLAQPLTGPAVRAVKAVAKERRATIICGMPTLDEHVRGQIHNSCVVATPDGALAAYHKAYLPTFGPFEERIYYTPGREIVVAQAPFGRIGLTICYDLFFPELARGAAMRGADILACISAAPNTSKPLFETIIPARAVENASYVLYANLTGTELNMVFWGGSCAYGPRGELVARGKYFEEELVRCELDLGLLPAARRVRPTVRDTRVELWDQAVRLPPEEPPPRPSEATKPSRPRRPPRH